MITFFHYLRLQFKAAFRLVPKLIAGMIVFAFLAFLIGYAGSKTLSKSGRLFYFRVAVVLPENDPLVNIGFNMLAEMESLKSYCEFIRTDEDAAKDLFASGDVYGIVYIPEGFVEDVLNGTNTPAKILLPDNSGIETVLFKSVLNAGSSTLAYVQSGIYAMTDTYIHYGIGSAVSDASDRLNNEYIRFVMARGNLFETETVSSTGTLTLPQFFVCTGIMLLLLFTGITLGGYINQESDELETVLKRNGITPLFTVVCKTLILTLLYGILFLGLITAAKAGLPLVLSTETSSGAMNLFFEYNPANIGIFFLCTMLAVSFIILIFRLAGSGLYGVLLLFMANIVLLFVSGCIIPSAYLPKAAALFGEILPTGFLRRLLGGLYTHSTAPAAYAAALGYVVLFTVLSGLCTKRHAG